MTACTTHQGTDGRTYAWFKPLPSSGTGVGTTSGVGVSQVTVNGTGYTIIGGTGR